MLPHKKRPATPALKTVISGAAAAPAMPATIAPVMPAAAKITAPTLFYYNPTTVVCNASAEPEAKDSKTIAAVDMKRLSEMAAHVLQDNQLGAAGELYKGIIKNAQMYFSLPAPFAFLYNRIIRCIHEAYVIACGKKFDFNDPQCLQLLSPTRRAEVDDLEMAADYPYELLSVVLEDLRDFLNEMQLYNRYQERDLAKIFDKNFHISNVMNVRGIDQWEFARKQFPKQMVMVKERRRLMLDETIGPSFHYKRSPDSVTHLLQGRVMQVEELEVIRGLNTSQVQTLGLFITFVRQIMAKTLDQPINNLIASLRLEAEPAVAAPQSTDVKNNSSGSDEKQADLVPLIPLAEIEKQLLEIDEEIKALLARKDVLIAEKKSLALQNANGTEVLDMLTKRLDLARRFGLLHVELASFVEKLNAFVQNLRLHIQHIQQATKLTAQMVEVGNNLSAIEKNLGAQFSDPQMFNETSDIICYEMQEFVKLYQMRHGKYAYEASIVDHPEIAAWCAPWVTVCEQAVATKTQIILDAKALDDLFGKSINSLMADDNALAADLVSMSVKLK